MNDKHLSEIEDRDVASAETWFTGPASFTAQSARDRRALLGEVKRLRRLVRLEVLSKLVLDGATLNVNLSFDGKVHASIFRGSRHDSHNCTGTSLPAALAGLEEYVHIVLSREVRKESLISDAPGSP